MNDPLASRIDSPDQRGLARLLGLGIEPAPAPQIGDYELHALLGEGGMGEVWRATQLGTRRQVAVKLLTSAAFRSGKARVRFQREVTLAARLEHPNIARVYDSGLHRGQDYYVMELIEGVHLDAYTRDGRLDAGQVLGLMQTVCRAVDFAHRQGVIHRDLKPSNILVSGDGQPHILDFGLAKAVAEVSDLPTVSLEGQVAGTLAFMSPEQAAGKVDELDARTDVFSLGVMLYRLLTDQSPHDLTGSQLEVQSRIATEEVRRPRDVCRGIDRSLEAILLRALAQQPERRYASAGELADDIGRYLDGQPPLARPQSGVHRAARWLIKRRLAAMVVITLLTMLGGIAILGHMLMTQGALRRGPSAAPPRENGRPAVINQPSADARKAQDAASASIEEDFFGPSIAVRGDAGPELALVPGVVLKLVRVATGQFLMGSPDDEPGRFADEGPQHEVIVSRPFYLGACEVTRAQFAAFVTAARYGTEAEKDGWATIWTGNKWTKVEGASWRNPGFEQGDDHPVVCVSWNDARAFCAWARKQTGRAVRLPSEAEWEYACRAGSATRYQWGDDPDGGGGWCNGSNPPAGKAGAGGESFAWDDGYVYTAPVGEFKPNAFGLYDMHGNVWEWCADWYEPYAAAEPSEKAAEKTSEKTAEKGAEKAPDAKTRRVLRGDSWAGGPNVTRCAFRSRRLPEDRANHIGFRVAVETE